jgi:L-ascorbate metabolism protein UlaG (beta-lactamase superfamily)
MRRTTRCEAFVLVAAMFLAGCGHIIPAELTGTGTPFDFAQHVCHPNQDADTAKVEVRTHGSGGALIRWRGQSLLLGASFSNPGLLRAYFWRGRGNDAPIDGAPPAGENVCAILAGHSHYDHIGDLPAVAKRFPKATIYLNASGANIVHGEHLDVERIWSGKTFPVGSAFRVTAIESGHAPQLCPWNHFPCTYATGSVGQARTARMSRQRLRTMRGGDALAFDIELLGEHGETLFRIYYNDSSAASPLGQTAGPFDLAILTMAQWRWVHDYPRHLLLELQPRHVLVSHWDYFFQPTTESSKFVPRLNAGDYLRIVNEVVPEGDATPTNSVCGVTTKRYTMAVPGSSLLFNPNVSRSVIP